MNVGNISIPLRATVAGFRKFTVQEYHRLIRDGFLTEDDDLELLEGYLVKKMTRNPPHDACLQRVYKRLPKYLPPGWDIRIQSAVTLVDSEPEPDVAVVRGDEDTYLTRHPITADVGTVIEISDSTLDSDRSDKLRIFARSRVPVYWIINLVDRQIEVYTQPNGSADSPDYAQREDFRPGEQIPLALDGQVVAQVPVSDLLP
jgi:Uma2 family endonuclease